MEISEQTLLAVLADFDALGGASPALIAWELYVAEDAVLPVWGRAVAHEWIVASQWDRVHGEQLWRLTPAGWRVLDGPNPNHNLGD